MATNTPNYNFDLREGTDIFNPLSSNANWESLDTLLKTIQETGGITTYTTTASANLLKLSGTPVANDTVFKFVAAGNANTWTAASGGVVNNIVGLDGIQMTIQGGNMYVAWINSANSMVCVVWPEVVNAQTFDGKGPAEWATKVQLDAVNQTAGNATQTAQAAATVANQALEAAQKAGLTMKQVWQNPGSFETGAATWSKDSDAKFLIVTYASGSLGAAETMAVVVPIGTSGTGSITKTHVTYNGHIILVCKPYTLTADGITFNTAYRAELTNGQSAAVDASESNIFIMKIYEVK